MFPRLLVGNDQDGNLVDEDGHRYCAEVDGKGVHLTPEGSQVPSPGAVVDGSRHTCFTQTSGALAGFSFQFFPPGKGQTSAGLFRFPGSFHDAEQALKNAGFHVSLLDELFNIYEMIHNPNSVNFRSPGDSRTGANSGHVLLDLPKLAWKSRDAAPVEGKLHFGETNPKQAPLRHLREVFHWVPRLFEG